MGKFILTEAVRWNINPKYQEIIKLATMLNAVGVPYTISRFSNGWHFCYPESDPEKRVCSVIEYKGSYGHEIDRLEIMGLLTECEAEFNSVAGWLTAGDVFARITNHWTSQGEA